MSIEQRRGPEGQRQPTEAQKAAAGMKYFLHVDQLTTTIAQDYATEHKGNYLAKRRKRRQAKQALTDYYFIKAYGLPEEPFREKWGADAAAYEHTISAHMPLLAKKKNEILSNAADINGRERFMVTFKTTNKINKLPEDQKAALLQMAGFQPSESVKIAEKLGVSGVWTAVTGAIANGSVGAAVTYETWNNHGETLADPKTLSALLLSYGLHYGAMTINGITNVRLMESPAVQTCPNILSTVLFFLGQKATPEHHFLPRAGALGGTYSWAAIQEPAAIIGMAIPGGAEIVTARNYAGAAFNAAEATGNTIWQYVAEKRKKRRDHHES